ncbi:MAG: aminotransferase class V-fold PLP-dependent enzyme [Candidatus Marinimicrobia bacterium]|nr:aminotransferase class V-fold PLP-dependent enzyme [bacterium]MCG2715439.1 aminotransferase class V-fold PLP-dependent enzyme [Candidatus Neomarinimicrobiota bacterium]
MTSSTSLEKYFQKFRRNVVGYGFKHQFPSGKKPIIYTDWAASGRLYKPIEDYISRKLGPYVANTHTESTLTGTIMTSAYHQAHDIIKRHVNASEDDVLLFAGFGMTAVINKFQRILGLRIPEKYKDKITMCEKERPLVIVTHMEHHSNQTTWEECCVDIAILCKKSDGTPNLDHLRDILEINKERNLIIGSFTACSNVTGIITPFYEMSEIMHEFDRLCFVDFSASAPYVSINMHPKNKEQRLDTIFFSPHKFLGGPGASGVIIFNKKLYDCSVPDHPGGGTVAWTTPWHKHRFFKDIEIREDGGTPGFLQAIKASLAILLKEEMGVAKLMEREHWQTNRFLDQLERIDGIEILEKQNRNRIGFISFYSHSIHHNLFVRLLNDRYGIQTRGGCLCAGTYGHVLLHINEEKSREITEKIDHGDLSIKPGWVRVSLHPTLTNKEVDLIAFAIKEIVINYKEWQKDYRFDPHVGDYERIDGCTAGVNIAKGFKT